MCPDDFESFSCLIVVNFLPTFYVLLQNYFPILKSLTKNILHNCFSLITWEIFFNQCISERKQGEKSPKCTSCLLSVLTTEYIYILVEMKQGQCICPLSWSVHCNFTGEGKCSERGWACTPHPYQPGLMRECTPDIGRYHSVYSVVLTSCGFNVKEYLKKLIFSASKSLLTGNRIHKSG
jgi:hypothetical protein